MPDYGEWWAEMRDRDIRRERLWWLIAVCVAVLGVFLLATMPNVGVS